MKKDPIPFAIAYDFDGTLAPGNMQEHNFIAALNIKPQEFWAEAKELSQKNSGDQILSYMYLMLEKAREKHIKVHRKDFLNFGESIQFFPGLPAWFERINKYGKALGVNVRHYIISSGLREMIEGTEIARKIDKIYASGFMYDHNDAACWPALAINYTTKTQYLFRINKGSLDEWDNSQINAFVPPEERPVPFSNMVFIGDGETDIPSMRLVKSQGGHAIAVYKARAKGAREKVNKLVKEGRANIAAKADYSANSNIEKAVQAMIDKVVAQQKITSIT